MLKRLSILLALLGIGAVTMLVFRLKKPQPAPQPLVEPSRAPYADSIGARGMVEAIDENVLKTRILPQIPVGRLGTPEEIGRCVVFLAADDAGFITGSTISANGGQNLV